MKKDRWEKFKDELTMKYHVYHIISAFHLNEEGMATRKAYRTMYFNIQPEVETATEYMDSDDWKYLDITIKNELHDIRNRKEKEVYKEMMISLKDEIINMAKADVLSIMESDHGK